MALDGRRKISLDRWIGGSLEEERRAEDNMDHPGH